jgi:hypothetical protein
VKKKEKPLVNLLAIPGSDKECKKCIMHHILKILSSNIIILDAMQAVYTGFYLKILYLKFKLSNEKT